jgi:hypothetical protein
MYSYKQQKKYRTCRNKSVVNLMRSERACHWTQGSRVKTRPRTMDFKGDKIRSTPSFGGGVKPSVPCRRFTACKRTLRAWKYAPRQNSAAVFLTRVSPASLLDVSGGWIRMTITRLSWGCNPHRNIPNRHETRKGGQGPTLGCSAIDDDETFRMWEQFFCLILCYFQNNYERTWVLLTQNRIQAM